ncbi:MAG: DoxX family membrane protein [Gemmatimonadota bacterium]|nr:DoxX family membrane protein [Gemmatimonadota bacterium]MDH5196023.1 DoxX family membrane protein [Gemmatimonadota bacterium]
MTTVKANPYTGFQLGALVALRLLIGWHFFYEGLAKLVNPYWTSAEYIDQASWLFKGMFESIAASPGMVTAVDALNVWGLMAIGLGLIVGLLTRTATVAGIVVLGLYYIVAPPFVGLSYAMPTEGSYLVVNKVLIEAVALLVLFAFPTGRQIGIDAVVFRKRPALGQPQPQA